MNLKGQTLNYVYLDEIGYYKNMISTRQEMIDAVQKIIDGVLDGIAVNCMMEFYADPKIGDGRTARIYLTVDEGKAIFIKLRGNSIEDVFDKYFFSRIPMAYRIDLGIATVPSNEYEHGRKVNVLAIEKGNK